MCWRNGHGKGKAERGGPGERYGLRRRTSLYLDVGFEEDHAPTLLRILGDIARSKGMEQEVVEAGLDPEYLIGGTQFREEPDLSALLAIVRVLGLRLHAGTAPSPTP